MSDVVQLKLALGGIGADAMATAANLQTYKDRLRRARQAVLASIRGSSTQADQQILLQLDAAERAVNEAIHGLELAQRAAIQYAQGL